MTVKEAYRMLGIKEDSSEKDAQRAYRNIARSKHPDKGVSLEAEEELKIVSAAYDLVKKNLKNPDKAQEEELKDYKYKNIGILNNFRNHQNFNDLPLEYKTNIENINTIIEDNIFMISIASGFVMIDLAMKSAYERILEEYKKIARDFFSKENLDSSFLEELNFRVDIKSFFESLEKIKAREERKILAFSELDRIVSEYLNQEENQVIRKDILREVKKVKDKCSQNAYREYEKFGKILRERIINLIKTYSLVRQKLDVLTNYFMQKYDEFIFNEHKTGMSFKDLNIIVEINRIRADYATEMDVNLAYKRVLQLEKRVAPKEIVSPSKERVLELYHRMSSLACRVLEDEKVKMKYSEIVLIASSLQRLGEIINSAYDGNIPKQELEYLNGLSFKELEKDALILEQFGMDVDRIYVRKTPITGTDGMIYVIIEDNKELFMVDYRNVTGRVKINVTLKQLERDYVSLRDFISNIKFIGHNVLRYGIPEIVLYSWDYKLSSGEYERAKNKSLELQNYGITEDVKDVYSYYVILTVGGNISIVPKFPYTDVAINEDVLMYQDSEIFKGKIIEEISKNKVQKRALKQRSR